MLDDRDFPEIPGVLMGEPVAHELRHEMRRLLARRKPDFPGSQPVSFQAHHLHHTLLERDYFVCEKSDGLRCLLFCLLDPNGDEAVFLVTRENQFYRVPEFHFPVPDDEAVCHNRTLVDGELVVSTRPDGVKELRFLMFDCLAINGLNITSRPLPKRLGYLDEQFFRPYYRLRTHHPKECDVFPFKLSLKNMHLAYKIPKLFDNLKYLGHVSDGLIFTCCETPYVPGTDDSLLKWKPAEENTVDFQLRLDIPLFIDDDLPADDPNRAYPNYDVKPGFQLWVWQGGDAYARFDQPLEVSDDEWDRLKALQSPLQHRIVECNKVGHSWHLLRFRDDKSNGNHVSVVHKVLKSIDDAISKEQLIAQAPEIEACWKRRELARKAKPAKREIPGYDYDDDDEGLEDPKKQRRE